MRAHAGVDDGELGVALLCVGAGALATMRPAGALVDRFGARVLPITVALFGVSAVLPALAGSAVALSAALLVLGAASGAFDVAVNAEGVRAEAAAKRPLLNLGHAAFSGAVVGASLATGALRAAGAGATVVLALAGGLLVACGLVLAQMPPAPAAPRPRRRVRLGLPLPLAVLGGLTALAFFVENAWQSWSALHLEETLGAPAALAALGPALFATAAASGRLAGQRLAGRVGDRVLVAGGAAIAAAGSLVAAAAPSSGVALAGIALAGAGTSVCAPTLISLAGRSVAAEERGSAVSIVTTIAYLGFLVGPAAVGLAADALSLRTALGSVAGVALLLALGARLAPSR